MQPLFLSIALVITLGGFGTWKLLRHQRHRVELQMRLDQDSGEAAMRFRNLQNAIARENTEIKALRAAAAAALALQNAAGVEAAQLAAKAIALIQDGRVKFWYGAWAQSMTHGMNLSMEGESSWPRWTRAPEDLLGPQVLEWEGGPSVTFEARQDARRSRAAAYESSRRWHAVFL